MSITFDEVIGFNRKHNEQVYEDMRDSIAQLLPFVGAGLTAPVYGGWGHAINSLGETIASTGTRRQLRKLAKSDPLEAAQFLEDQLGEVGLRARLARHFSHNKLDEKWDAIENGAIWLMPELFARPVLTTNFDQALERVYRTRGFIDFEVLDPTSEDLQNQATRLLNEACVFKLHGTVTGRMTDYSKLVFIKAQYDVHYAPESPIRQALAKFMRSRIALFLGCSLKGDRTVDVLKETADPGIFHFAIVDCKPNERDARIRELADANIRPIVYKSGEYDSVRVILQQLLDDTKSS